MPENENSITKRNRWCEPIRGLSGRLRIELEDLQPGLRYATYAELRNHSPQALAVIDQPEVKAELLNSIGKPVGTVGIDMSGPIPEPQWGVIPRQAYLGLRIDMRTVGMPVREQGRALLALGGQAWELAPGKYCLQLTLIFKKNEPEGSQNQWTGELALPAVEIIVPQIALTIHGELNL